MTSGTATLSALYGSIELMVLDLPFQATKATVTMGGTTVPSTYGHGSVFFTSKLVIPAGSTLTVTLASAHVSCSIPDASACCTPKERAQCCPPGTDCAPVLRQRCCPQPEKAGEAKQAEAEQLQDTPGTAVVVVAGARQSYTNVCLVLFIGIMIGLYMPAILRFINGLAGTI